MTRSYAAYEIESDAPWWWPRPPSDFPIFTLVPAGIASEIRKHLAAAGRNDVRVIGLQNYRNFMVAFYGLWYRFKNIRLLIILDQHGVLFTDADFKHWQETSDENKALWEDFGYRGRKRYAVEAIRL